MKLLIIDDEAHIRQMMRLTLETAGSEVDEAPTGEEGLKLFGDGTGYAAVLLDQKMPGMTGLELQAVLEERRLQDGLLVIFLTGHGDIPMSVEAMKAGAFDFLSKPVEEGPLVQTVQRALDESARVRSSGRERFGFLDRWRALSGRQREVCVLVLRGRLNKEIAFELGIAEKTVKIHRAQAMAKLGVRSVAELARMAERSGALGRSQ